MRLENDAIRVTVLVEGGHIAEILDKSTGVNPLWIPPWPSIEVSAWSPEAYPVYGNDSESKLLAGIMGHNLCLDLFGPPSDEEAAAGMVAHAEGGVVTYAFEPVDGGLRSRCVLPASQLAFERVIKLDGRRARITETVDNLVELDRPIAWTQHVTLGPPFLERGKTAFRVPATRSQGIGERAEFEWPWWPRPDGGMRDLRLFTDAEASSGFSTHLLDPAQSTAWFAAWSPTSKVAMGYVWNRADFPWIGIWEENHGRTHTPWLGRTRTRGMEFGVSPWPETRRRMIDRGSMWGLPAYRWIPAKGRLTAEYYAGVAPAESVPETLESFVEMLDR